MLGDQVKDHLLGRILAGEFAPGGADRGDPGGPGAGDQPGTGARGAARPGHAGPGGAAALSRGPGAAAGRPRRSRRPCGCGPSSRPWPRPKPALGSRPADLAELRGHHRRDGGAGRGGASWRPTCAGTPSSTGPSCGRRGTGPWSGCGSCCVPFARTYMTAAASGPGRRARPSQPRARGAGPGLGRPGSAARCHAGALSRGAGPGRAARRGEAGETGRIWRQACRGREPGRRTT